jgi:hypothetical protein
MLGYRPYHMYEVLQSTTHMGIFEEALNAKYFGVGKPYGKAEFDKWFADYDTLVEIPAFFVEDIIAAYPDATFIHVDRDTQRWAASVTNVREYRVFHAANPRLSSHCLGMFQNAVL